MNLMLIQDNDFIAADLVRVADRRAEHIRKILKAEVGDSLKTGKADGMIGEGVIMADEPVGITLRINLNDAPPPPSRITLLLAMPRPIALRRMLPAITTFGVKNIHLFHAAKVEKSYWTSSIFTEFRELLTLGLEQACDTVYPLITLHRRFKVFVEDEIPDIIKGSLALAAHPGSGRVCPTMVEEAVTVCIGPEGGFTDYEVKMLTEAGFITVGLGERILRSETAVPAILGRLIK